MKLSENNKKALGLIAFAIIFPPFLEWIIVYFGHPESFDFPYKQIEFYIHLHWLSVFLDLLFYLAGGIAALCFMQLKMPYRIAVIVGYIALMTPIMMLWGLMLGCVYGSCI